MRLKLQTTINDFATNFLQINDKRSAAKTAPRKHWGFREKLAFRADLVAIDFRCSVDVLGFRYCSDMLWAFFITETSVSCSHCAWLLRLQLHQDSPHVACYTGCGR